MHRVLDTRVYGPHTIREMKTKQHKSPLAGIGSKPARALATRTGSFAGVIGAKKSKAARRARQCRGRVRDY